LPGAFSELLKLTEDKYEIDLTVIDLNPGLSAVNQNFFLISDGFLIPTNPDPFSLMALNTLRLILPRWTSWKQSAVDIFADSAYPLPAGRPKFLGTLIQRFNIRRGRAAKPYRDNIEEIKELTSKAFFDSINAAGMTLPLDVYGTALIQQGYCLAEIPDFQALLPKAFDAGVPVFELTDKELEASGPVLAGMQEKRALFRKIFDDIAARVVTLIGHD
jgi:hypothetical protein